MSDTFLSRGFTSQYRTWFWTWWALCIASKSWTLSASVVSSRRRAVLRPFMLVWYSWQSSHIAVLSPGDQNSTGVFIYLLWWLSIGVLWCLHINSIPNPTSGLISSLIPEAFTNFQDKPPNPHLEPALMSFSSAHSLKCLTVCYWLSITCTWLGA